MPAQSLEGTVWQSLPETTELDAEELRRMFTVKAPPKKSLLSTPRELLGKKKSLTMLLDLKRSNQISIALAKFKCSHAQLRDALLRLDDNVIKAEDISRIRQSCIPTTDELELLQPYLDPRSTAGAVEKTLQSAEVFLTYMARVPRLTQRLECFHTKLSLPTRLADASAQINALNAAAASVRTSQLLPKLLSLVLAAGNVLNAGTLKGNAKGFRLEVLQKLAETKSGSVEPQVSLLHHIATGLGLGWAGLGLGSGLGLGLGWAGLGR